MSTESRQHYKTGNKSKMLRMMARFAIRDQEALIDAYTSQFGEPDEVAAEVIRNANYCIEDFRKFVKTLAVSD